MNGRLAYPLAGAVFKLMNRNGKDGNDARTLQINCVLARPGLTISHL